MKNIMTAVAEKVAKLEASKLKWEAIFDKSEATRNASIENLKLALAKKEKMAAQIAAKKEKVLATIDAKIVAAQNEACGQDSSEAQNEAQLLKEIEAEEMAKEFYANQED